VRVAKCSGNLDGNVGDLTPVEPSTQAQFLLQAAALDQFHGVEQNVLIVSESVQADDVAMLQHAKRFDLAGETFPEAFLLAQRRGEHFHRGRFARVDAFGGVDRSHPPLAQSAKESVGAELFDRLAHRQTPRLDSVPLAHFAQLSRCAAVRPSLHGKPRQAVLPAGGRGWEEDCNVDFFRHSRAVPSFPRNRESSDRLQFSGFPRARE